MGERHLSASGQVVVNTDRFDEDFAILTEQFGFRVDTIFPADDPSTAVISVDGLRLRLVETLEPQPVTIMWLTDDDLPGVRDLPGGSRIVTEPRTQPIRLPDNAARLVITPAEGDAGAGRAGMLYRDLIPDRWGGRFIASHITIPGGGPVADYVHFHKVRFQLIFVKAGWVRVVYEDQGEPFVLNTGDAVLQPPEIRHRVLEASPGLEVIEIGTPAEHETIADWSMTLPNTLGDPDRQWAGQRFVRHIASQATYSPWRAAGWEYRDTGIGAATGGLAGVRIARPVAVARGTAQDVALDAEFGLLATVAGAVTIVVDDTHHRLETGASVAIPAHLTYRLLEPTPDCELLDVTLPAEPG